MEQSPEDETIFISLALSAHLNATNPQQETERQLLKRLTWKVMKTHRYTDRVGAMDTENTMTSELISGGTSL
jgi:hypothetical protein